MIPKSKYFWSLIITFFISIYQFISDEFLPRSTSFYQQYYNVTFLVEDYTPTENSYDSATENNFYIPNIDDIYHGVYSPEEPDYSDFVYENWNYDDQLEFDPLIVLAQNRQALMDFASPVRQSDSSYVADNDLFILFFRYF